MRWEPGDVVVWREGRHGQPWIGAPVRVFPTGWENRQPDSSWPVPQLPDGWER